MYKKKSIVIVALCIAVLFMVIVYAAFRANLSIITIGNITSNWSIQITSVENQLTGNAYNISAPFYSGTNASFNAGLTKPGDKAIYTITVKNIGTIDAIIDEIKANAEGSSAIIYSITGLQNNEKLLAGEEISFQVVVEFDNNMTSIPNDTVKTINMSIVCVQDQGQETTPSNPDFDGILNLPTYLSTQILLDNRRQSDENIDFSKISSDENGKGLYYTSTNTEDNKITYYFRGNVNNNFVRFGKDTSGNDLYWRIIRVNEDVSIRLLYNGTSTAATGADVTIGTGVFNDLVGSNAFVGYMYGWKYTEEGNSYEATHSNRDSSTIKTYLENWYINDTNLSSLRTTHLADSGFCNDRSIAPAAGLWDPNDTASGITTNITFYGVYNRLNNKYSPQFLCPNASNDLFTTNVYTRGNQSSVSPVGLITADEVAYAGGVIGSSNTEYYLYNGADYWTMSPHSLFDIARIFAVPSNGALEGTRVDWDWIGVRPVINLKSTVELSDELPNGCEKQEGTANCPYIIKTN